LTTAGAISHFDSGAQKRAGRGDTREYADDDEEEEKEEKEDDVDGFDRETDKRFRLIAVPGRVGGSPWESLS